MGNKATVLLTGATGYIGGRLLKRLETSGVSVRCLARRPEAVRVSGAPNVTVATGDLLDKTSLLSAMDGVQVAYYLVHSMSSAGAFEEEDRIAASNFAEAARQANVQRIIYLGGLGDSNQALSSHLRSRQEVGQILKGSGATVIEFQASIIIGSGSLSFEMIRALVERLPVMVTPRWVSVLAQPIYVDDVLDYLTAAATLPLARSSVFQIGGTDRVSYGAIMREYARQRHLRRLTIRVPVLTPYLSSLWLGLVTPLYARVGRRLIESIRHPTIVTEDAALQIFPFSPMGLKEMIDSALHSEDMEFAETGWAELLSSTITHGGGSVRVGNRLTLSHVSHIDAPPRVAFKAIERIGGQTGWYYRDWLWRLRGTLDTLLGGVGLRRGRRDAESVVVGDTVDCWRVDEFEPGRRLRLAAEMKLPGRAWLEFEVSGTRSSTIRQTAVFDPVGVLGLVYWYVLYPVHNSLFSGMLRQIARAAEDWHHEQTKED